jgi:lipoprotein NlpI/transglutaminase-like putative cysteine protease
MNAVFAARRAAARMATVLLLCASAMPGAAQAQTTNAPSTNAPQAAQIPFKEVQVAATSFFQGDPVPPWVEPVAMPDGNKSAPLVLRLVDTQFLVNETPVLYFRRALTVNDAASLTAAGQISIGFVPEYQRLHLHAIHVLRDSEVLDRTQSSTIRFLQRETGLEHGLYSGEVTASILVNDLRVGDTLDLYYSVEGQNPVFGGKFASLTGWDQRAPTALRRVVLNYPASREISWRPIGNWQSRPVVPVESTSDGMRKLRFQQAAVTEAPFETSMPADHVAFRALQFSEYRSWDDVVTWANGLFPFDGVHDEELRKVVARLRAMPTNDEKASAALEFVQSQVRYFSVSLGESSHRPATPDAVIKRRYGDCKDKSFLLISLLREAGIESSPVLVKLGHRKVLEGMLPSPQLFDHVIVKAVVDGNNYYLDPTRLAQYGHLNRMGQVHEGAQVLVVAPDVHDYATITTPNVGELLRNELTETAVLPKFDGNASFKVHQVWSGAAAENARLLFERLPKPKLTKLFGDALETRYPGALMTSEPQVADDRINNVVSVTAAYDVPKLATEKDGNWIVRFSATNLAGTLVTPSSAVRSAPLGVPRFPFEGKYSIEVKFPEEVSSVLDPSVTTLENKYFAYTVTEAFRGNVAKTTIDLKTLSSEVPAADLQKYAQDLQTLNNTRSAIFVPKGAIKSADPANGSQDFVQLLRDRLQESIKKVTETIDSGKITGKDLAEAHCLRGNGYTDLGQFDEALKDANQAIKLAPNHGKLFLCRAVVYLDKGDFRKAVADYSTAIVLGETDPRNFYLRGIANYYAGKLEDAASDETRAAEANDNVARLYSELWLSWISQRLGQPIPPAIVKQAVADPRGEWPLPALAMITGHLSPEEMLKLIDAKSGDERRMALAEGYFYLGQHYLTLGDKAKAREYFEKTRQLEVIIYTEHVAAAFELQRLTRGN